MELVFELCCVLLRNKFLLGTGDGFGFVPLGEDRIRDFLKLEGLGRRGI